MANYKINDILYQDNGKGVYMQSKVGEKYDERRGKIVQIYDEDLVEGSPYVLNYVGEQGYIITTPVQSFKTYTTEEKSTSFLATNNSIYVLEKVKE